MLKLSFQNIIPHYENIKSAIEALNGGDIIEIELIPFKKWFKIVFKRIK